MATPFRMLIHRDDDRLFIRLSGRLDRKAAGLLVRFLEAHGAKFAVMTLQSSALDAVDPAAAAALRQGLSALDWSHTRLVWTGRRLPDPPGPRASKPKPGRAVSAGPVEVGFVL